MDNKKPGPEPGRIGRKEMAELISERLRADRMPVREFIRLTNCLMSLRGWNTQGQGRPKGTKDLKRRKPGRWPAKEADIHDLVAEIENHEKEVN